MNRPSTAKLKPSIRKHHEADGIERPHDAPKSDPIFAALEAHNHLGPLVRVSEDDLDGSRGSSPSVNQAISLAAIVLS